MTPGAPGYELVVCTRESCGSGEDLELGEFYVSQKFYIVIV